MDKTFLGLGCASLEKGIASAPITKVELLNGSGEVVGVSGSDTGKTLTAVHPDGTNAMAAAILAQVSGYAQRGFQARGSIIDPAVELGDAVTVGGVYSVIASEDITLDALYSSDISAPDADEVDDEYPYQTYQQRIERKIASAYSRISKTEREIRLEVAGKIDGEEAQSLIDQTLDEISLSVSGTNGSTTFKLKQGGVTLDSTTFDLHVDAVNIEGSVTAETLRGRVVELLSSSDQTVGSLEIAYTTTGDGLGIYTNHGGIRMEADGNVFITSGYNTRLLLDDDAAKIGPTVLATNGDIIYESDRNVKNSIDYDLSRYRQFLLDLKPCRFKYNEGQSGRYHLGMIAQDMEQSLAENGISPMDFSGWCKMPIRNENHEITGYTYGIRYGALIPLNTMLIQELIRRVDELERRTAS